MIALAHAHGGAHSVDWAVWNVTPDILAGTLLVAVLYAAGLRRQRGKERAASRWRRWAFFTGLGAVFLALQSPLDALADRSFFMHQLQHLLLQTLGPMLLMLAAPQAVLAAGVPATLRRSVLAPVMASRVVRQIFGFLTHPWIAALLFAASLYVWHWPPYHDLAVLDDAVHYLMHFSMLAAGLLFFSVVFDPRPVPLGALYGTRINILWATMTANVLLGAALSLKDGALYSAYDQIGRLWEMEALVDEQLGGLIMWIPGSALCVPAFFVLLRMWNTQEARVEAWRGRGISSTVVSTANYRVALWLALAAFVGFAGTLGHRRDGHGAGPVNRSPMLTYPNIDPVAFSIGPLAVRWYGLMYLLGFAAGWWLGLRRIKQGLAPVTRGQFDELIFFAVLGVVLGGRLGYVLFYKPAYYAANPLEIFAVWQGGMSFHGGLLGVILAMVFVARRQGVDYLRLMDFLAPLTPLGLAAGRVANFINGELWGRATDLPWGMVFPGAGDAPRHPSQLYQAALEGLALFVILWWFSSKPRPRGQVSGLFLIGYGLFRFLAEFAREPDPYLGFLALGFTMGQWLSLPMIAAGLALFLWSARKGPLPVP